MILAKWALAHFSPHSRRPRGAPTLRFESPSSLAKHNRAMLSHCALCFAERGFGHELLSFLYRFAHKNLSTLDPVSPIRRQLLIELRLSNPHVKRAGALLSLRLRKSILADAFSKGGERGIRTLHVQYPFWIFCFATLTNYLKTASNPRHAFVKRKSCAPLSLFTSFTAERGGFEPPIGLPQCRLSKAVHSTALPSLRNNSYPAFQSG